MKSNNQRLAGLFGLVAAIALPNAAEAETLNIFSSSVGIQFNGITGELHETSDPDFVSPFDSDDSQEIPEVEFEFNGSEVATLGATEDVFFDFLISSLGSTLSLGAFETDQGESLQPDNLAFELFASDGSFLQLGIESIDFLGVQPPIIGTGIFFFTAEASVIDQDLPEGLEFEDEVVITFSASDATLGGTTSTSGFVTTGNLSITGAATIPEPSTILLIGLMAAGGLSFAKRRRLG